MGQQFAIDGLKYTLGQPEDQAEAVAASSGPKGDSGMTTVQEETELGQSLKELNLDQLEQSTGMSGIDMRARLHPIESAAVLALDALVGMQVLPTSCLTFTRQKKRLSVSNQGKGREEIVDVVTGKREHDKNKQSGGMAEWAGKMMGK